VSINPEQIAMYQQQLDQAATVPLPDEDDDL